MRRLPAILAVLGSAFIVSAGCAKANTLSAAVAPSTGCVDCYLEAGTSAVDFASLPTEFHESGKDFVNSECLKERENYDILVENVAADAIDQKGAASSPAEALKLSLSGIVPGGLSSDVTIDVFPALVSLHSKAFDPRLGDKIDQRTMWLISYNGVHIVGPDKYREPGDPGYGIEPPHSNFEVDFVDPATGYTAFTMFCE